MAKKIILPCRGREGGREGGGLQTTNLAQVRHMRNEELGKRKQASDSKSKREGKKLLIENSCFFLNHKNRPSFEKLFPAVCACISTPAMQYYLCRPREQRSKHRHLPRVGSVFFQEEEEEAKKDDACPPPLKSLTLCLPFRHGDLGILFWTYYLPTVEASASDDD